MEMTPAEIIEATGLSRSTVYRRLKNGATAEEIVAKHGTTAVDDDTSFDDVDPDDAPDDEQSAIAWARAVMWAAKHTGTRVTKKTAGLQRYSLWKIANDDPQAFNVQLVPKAIGLLDKLKRPDEDMAVDAAERSSIAELQELLEGAIAESLVT